MSYVRADGQPIRIPVPGLARDVRFGDAIATLTRAFGIRPCGRCKTRQVWLNKRLVFVPPRR